MNEDTRSVAWERTDGSRGHSVAFVSRTGDGYQCLATEVLAGPETLLSCSFVVDLAADWTSRSVRVSAYADGRATELALDVDEHRRWWRRGSVLSDLDGCVDVDVAATPLTNTFPIRRLANLAVGREVATPIAWVDVPTLRVSRVIQTYRRLDSHRWQYRDPLHGAFELTVDDDGLVIDYQGFARRVA